MDDLIIPGRAVIRKPESDDRHDLSISDLHIGCDTRDEHRLVTLLEAHRDRGNKEAILHPDAVEMLEEITERTKQRMKERLS
jgi:hypothetical protein